MIRIRKSYAALAVTVCLLPGVAAAQARIYQPGAGAYVGVPLNGAPVSVTYQGESLIPVQPFGVSPFFVEYDWTRDGANEKHSTGTPGKRSGTVTYTESALTRGLHVAGMNARTWWHALFTTFSVPSTDLNPYFVQYLPTVQIDSAPDSLMVNEPGWFEGSGSVDTEYSKTKVPVFEWDFGDGDVKPGAQQLKFYQSPGVYDVTLTVSDGTFSEAAQKTVRVQAVPYELSVINYLGHFQLGDLSTLEPTAATAIGDFSVSGAGSASIVPNLVAASNSAGALSVPAGGSAGGFAYDLSKPLAASTLEFWMKVPDPLDWPISDIPATPVLRAEIVRAPGWVLVLNTTVAQAGGHLGQLELIAADSLATWSPPKSISGPTMDLSTAHLVTISDTDATGVPVYALMIDGVSYGVLPNLTPVHNTRVRAFWPQRIATVSGQFPPIQPLAGLPILLGYYRGASIIYDEAVLYARIVTPTEAALRYKGVAMPDPSRPPPDPPNLCRGPLRDICYIDP